jgi:predicted negative regulator of RcsB-dependent stress response
LAQKHAPSDTLEQLESIGDRLMGWVSANPALVLGTAALILLTAAGIGGVRAWRSSSADAASAALAAIQNEYVLAMGGEAGDSTVPEPANPETARQVRTTFVERFASFAREHTGTPAQVLAALEASRIYEALGEEEPARDILQTAADAQPAGSPIRAVALRRLAALYETAGEFEAAAQSWAEANRPDEALALFARIRSEAPDYRLSPHVQARLAELQAAAD